MTLPASFDSTNAEEHGELRTTGTISVGSDDTSGYNTENSSTHSSARRGFGSLENNRQEEPRMFPPISAGKTKHNIPGLQLNEIQISDRWDTESNDSLEPPDTGATIESITSSIASEEFGLRTHHGNTTHKGRARPGQPSSQSKYANYQPPEPLPKASMSLGERREAARKRVEAKKAATAKVEEASQTAAEEDRYVPSSRPDPGHLSREATYNKIRAAQSLRNRSLRGPKEHEEATSLSVTTRLGTREFETELDKQIGKLDSRARMIHAGRPQTTAAATRTSATAFSRGAMETMRPQSAEPLSPSAARFSLR